MHIGGLRGNKTRREERREREQEAERGGRTIDKIEAKKPFAPVKRVNPRPQPAVEVHADAILNKRYHPSGPIPDQKTLFNQVIVPRQRVDILLDLDVDGGEAEVRQSVIEDIDKEGRLILAQTSPPFLKSDTGREAEFTFNSRYLELKGGGWLRVGYRAAIEEVVPNYPVTPMSRETVVIIPGPKELKPTTVRTAYRVVPPDDLDLRLVLWPDFTDVGLMDLSYGGVQFYHPVKWRWSEGRPIQLAVVTGRNILPMSGKVVRTGKLLDRWHYPHGWTSVHWTDADPDIRRKYEQLLNGIYRHLLGKRSGVAEKARPA